MRKELRFEHGDPTCHHLYLGRERSRPGEPEVVRELEHPLREPVVLAQQVARAMLKMRKLCSEPVELGKPFDCHNRAYRQRGTGS
jgi:hypothetical protein